MAAPSSLVAAKRPSRGLTITLWVLQVLAAAMFLMAGAGKFSNTPEVIQAFETIGLGQWFRYLTGGLEIVGALALLVPRSAMYGAILLACVMAGAVLTHLLVLPGSAVPALVLMVVCLFIAWGRRTSIGRHARSS